MRFLIALLPALLLASGPEARLVDAEKNADKAAVQELLAHHADVNLTAPDGATALHWAAYWDDVPTAKQLIAAGAVVDAKNRYGVTPLSLACTNGSAAMVDLLLNSKADVNLALPGGKLR